MCNTSLCMHYEINDIFDKRCIRSSCWTKFYFIWELIQFLIYNIISIVVDNLRQSFWRIFYSLLAKWKWFWSKIFFECSFDSYHSRKFFSTKKMFHRFKKMVIWGAAGECTESERTSQFNPLIFFSWVILALLSLALSRWGITSFRLIRLGRFCSKAMFSLSSWAQQYSAIMVYRIQNLIMNNLLWNSIILIVTFF